MSKKAEEKEILRQMGDMADSVARAEAEETDEEKQKHQDKPGHWGAGVPGEL